MAAAFAAAPVLTSVLIASTVATVAFTAVSTIQARKASKRQRQAEKQKEEQLALQGVQQANTIREDQLAALAAANVAAAGSGIDISTGSPLSTREKIDQRAERQLRTSQLDNAFALAASESRQNQLRLTGRAALIQGGARIAGAAGGVAGSIGSVSPVSRAPVTAGG